MKRNAFHLAIPLQLVLALAISPALADDPSLDRLLASQCAQCHGTDGKAVGKMDSLAGESADSLFDDMRKMKDKDPDKIMRRQARGYSDDQLRRISRYYERMKN